MFRRATPASPTPALLPLCSLSAWSPLCLQSMLCARFPMRSFTLRSSADRPLPVLTPVGATVSETTKSHHACSAERADQVTYSGDQARVAVCNLGKRSHNVSPCCGGSHRRMHRTSCAGPQEPLEGVGQGLRPLASDSNVRATESPNTLLTKNVPSSLPSCKRSNGRSSAEETGVDA